jgi:hypothetical protein
MKRTFFSIGLTLLAAFVGCTAKMGPEDTGTGGSAYESSGTGGEGAGPTGTSGDAPAESTSPGTGPSNGN